VCDPRLPPEKRGTTNDALVLNLDVAPTLLAAAGVRVPETGAGKDVAPLYLSAEPPKWRDEFYYLHPVIIAKDRIPRSEAVVRPRHQVHDVAGLRLRGAVRPAHRPRRGAKTWRATRLGLKRSRSGRRTLSRFRDAAKMTNHQ